MLPDRLQHALWYQPGECMQPDWWSALGLAEWQQPYQDHPGLRPALDRLLVSRLGQPGRLPGCADPALLAALGDVIQRRRCVMALGLHALASPDYLLCKPWRQVLSADFSPAELTRLLMVLPGTPARAPHHPPAALPTAAQQLGVAWLAAASEPELAAYRLLWPPPAARLPARPLRALLTRIMRWL